MRVTRNIADVLTQAKRADLANVLTEILDDPKVSLSWTGSRIVTVKGYEGYTDIETLAGKCLALAMRSDLTLKERLQTHNAWKSLQSLHKKSERKLSSTTYCFCTVFNILQYNPFVEVFEVDAEALVCHSDPNGLRDKLFDFSQEEFKKHWDFNLAEVITENDQTRYRATKEMVREAIELLA